MIRVFFIFLMSNMIIGRLYAQSYTPFPLEEASWRELHSDQSGWSRDIYSINMSKQDTIIFGKKYKPLLKNGTTTYYSFGGRDIVSTRNYSNQYIGSIREENKKIYFLDVNKSVEDTLYDFNGVKIGDTLTQRKLYGMSFSTYTVYSIDSVKVGTTYRKRYWINPPFTLTQGRTLHIIEGIGSNMGLIPYYNDFEIKRYSWCHSIKDNLVYQSSPDIQCLTPSKELKENKNIEIYPNPVSGILNIETNDITSLTKLILYDFTGKPIISKNLTESSTQSLDLSILPNGLYTLVLGLEKTLIIKKIIVAK